MMERFARDITDGSYAPSFFTIRIPNAENYEHLLTGNRLSDSAEAYFLHEYIHFLQDLTTIPGLSNIGIVVDYMKWATHQGKDGRLKVPCNPTCQDGYNLYPNLRLGEARIGQGKLKENGADVLIASISKVSLNPLTIHADGRCFNQINTIVSFEDSNGKIWDYSLGEHAISECMAYTIEQLLYPEVLSKGADCPYSIVLHVCDKEIPGFSTDKTKVIALCDACLMFSFPGGRFQLAIDILKHVDYNSLTAEEVFDLLVDNPRLHEAEHINKHKIGILEHFESYSTLAAKQLSDYFTTANYDNEKDFSVLMLYASRQIRKGNPHFFS